MLEYKDIETKEQIYMGRRFSDKDFNRHRLPKEDYLISQMVKYCDKEDPNNKGFRLLLTTKRICWIYVERKTEHHFKWLELEID